MRGSRKPNLHVEAVAISSILVANYIRIELEWVPRENCQLIDYVSRIKIMMSTLPRFNGRPHIQCSSCPCLVAALA